MRFHGLKLRYLIINKSLVVEQVQCGKVFSLAHTFTAESKVTMMDGYLDMQLKF